MKCPIDGATLVMTERHGVEIDYCPTCRGIWLDRGELDKIIERVETPAAAPVTLQEPAGAHRPQGYPDPRDDHRRADRGQGRRDGGRAYEGDPEDRRYRKRREGFLSDLFDF